MVVSNRIAYLRNLLQHGAKLTFTASVNPSTGMQKFKIIVDPSTHVPAEQQFCALHMLDYLGTLCSFCRIVDKGHKHSDGRSEVLLYITGSSTPREADPLPIDVELPMAPDANLTVRAAPGLSECNIMFGESIVPSTTAISTSGGNVDCDFISSVLGRRCSSQDIEASLDEIEAHSLDKLDEIASYIGDLLNVCPSSWEDLRATVCAIAEDEEFPLDSEITLAQVILHAYDVYGPLPESGAAKRSRHD